MAEPLIEPTPDEARNGWTAESLTRYLRERGGPQDVSLIRVPDRHTTIRVEGSEDIDLHDW